MSAFEIVATVVLCIIGLCLVMLWGWIMIISQDYLEKFITEKKPAPKNETDEEKGER